MNPPLSKDVLCQVWLKSAKRFLKRRLLNIDYVFSLIGNYFPFKMGVALHLNKLDSPSSKNDLCKFGWNLPSCSEEEDFKNSLLYFRYFTIIPPLKRVYPFIWNTLNSLQPKMLCVKFGRNWLSGSREFGSVFSLLCSYSPLEKRVAFSLNKLKFPLPKDAFCKVWVVLEKHF